MAEASAPWSSRTRNVAGAVVAGGGAGRERIERDAGGGRRRRQSLEQEARAFRRAVEGDGARPRVLGGGDIAGVGRLVAAQQRQVEEERQRLADDDDRAARRRAHRRRGAGVDVGIEAARLDVAVAVLADLGDAQQARAAVDGERDERRPARARGGSAAARRRHARAPPRPRTARSRPSRAACSGSSTSGRSATAMRPLWPTRRRASSTAGGIVAGGGDEGELGGGRQVGLLRAGEGGERLVRATLDQEIGRQLGGAAAPRRAARRRCGRSLSRASMKKASWSGSRASRADSTRSMTKPASMPVRRPASCAGKP